MKLKKGTTKKAAVLLAAQVLAIIAVVGATVAFLVVKSDEIVNLFTPSEVTCEVKETLSGTTKSNVYIQNTGDTEAYIRAAVIVTWQDASGNVYGQKPVSNVESSTNYDYEITFNLTDGWVKGSDGFYYYTSPVAANGGETENLITSCSLGTGKAPDGYSLNVEIIASAIQSVPTRVVTSSWSSGVSSVSGDHGTLTIK